jgi:5-methylcytosine-specific restriction endonuclease McrA
MFRPFSLSGDRIWRKCMDAIVERTRKLRNYYNNRDKYNAQRREHRRLPEVRAKEREYDRRWRAEHPEEYQAQLRRKSKARLTLRFQIFQRDGFQCCYCGRKPPEVTLHVDHLHPVSEGGTNDPSNLVTACSHCNWGKADVLLASSAQSARLRG